MKHVFLSLLLIALGATLAITGHRQWSVAPERSYSSVQARVLDHEVRLNRQRWDDDVPRAVELVTRVAVESGNGSAAREAFVQSFFSSSELAWKSALSRPVGTSVSCLVAPDLKQGVFDSFTPSGDMLTVIIGSVILLAGIVLLLPLRPPPWGQPVLVTSVLLLFFIAGVFMASHFWPAVAQHVKAADWDLVPCKVAAHRSIRSGKSTTREFLVRYTAGGRQREAVLNGAFFGCGVENRSARQCRVNPEKPWQITLSWGWRPGLGVALFPVPFIAVGFLGLSIPFATPLRRQTKARRNIKSMPRKRWSEPAGLGLALVFVGSIVGVFVSLCAEMWLEAHAARWFLTLFLIPFVAWVLKIAVTFVSSIRKALRS